MSFITCKNFRLWHQSIWEKIVGHWTMLILDVQMRCFYHFLGKQDWTLAIDWTHVYACPLIFLRLVRVDKQAQISCIFHRLQACPLIFHRHVLVDKEALISCMHGLEESKWRGTMWKLYSFILLFSFFSFFSQSKGTIASFHPCFASWRHYRFSPWGLFYLYTPLSTSKEVFKQNLVTCTSERFSPYEFLFFFYSSFFSFYS